jgi:hypothetical protein
MNSIINKKALRTFALEMADYYRSAAGFERVSEQFLIRMEAECKSRIIAAVKAQPSIGKTIK